VSGVPEHVGYWLAGFTDGEGSFVISRRRKGGYACSFVIKLRADDKPLLLSLVDVLGIGRVVDSKPEGRNPQAAWIVCKKSECLFLTEIFDEYRLNSKKRRDYQVWREAVVAWAAIDGSGADWSLIGRCHDEIREVRQYAEAA
jgi:hypothetical protein